MADKETKKTPARQEVQAERVSEGTTGTYYTPLIDVYEDDDVIVVEGDMPGVDRSGVEVKIDEGLLTVVGRVERKSVKDVTQLYEEYVPGDFYRAFSLGEAIEEGKIAAVMKDGVLTVTLPKVKEARTRKIVVKGE